MSDIDPTCPRRWLWRRIMAFCALVVILCIAGAALFHEVAQTSAGLLGTIVWACVTIIGFYFGGNGVVEAFLARGKIK